MAQLITTPSKEGQRDERPHEGERHEHQPGFSLELSHGTSLFLKWWRPYVLDDEASEAPPTTDDIRLEKCRQLITYHG